VPPYKAWPTNATMCSRIEYSEETTLFKKEFVANSCILPLWTSIALDCLISRHKTREQHLFYLHIGDLPRYVLRPQNYAMCFFTVLIEALKMAIFWRSKGHRLQNACKVLNFLLLARKKRKALMQSLSRVLVLWNRCEYRERFQFPDIFGYF